MTIALADREVRNAIEEAVYVVLGGVREAAKQLDVSTQAVYQLLGAEVVKNRDTALKIEAKTAEVGCKIPAAELMALVEWVGPARHPDPGRGRRGPKERTPRTLRTAPRPDAGLADQPTARAAQQPRGSRRVPTWNTTSKAIGLGSTSERRAA